MKSPSTRTILFAGLLSWATPWAGLAQSNPPAPPTVRSLEETALAVDAVSKEYTAKPGEESCVFTFTVKNISNAEVTINQVSTSCGCGTSFSI